MELTKLDEIETLFSETCHEVDKYFQFLEFLMAGNVQVQNYKDSMNVDSDIVHTLKANGYILLYNLVEATVDNIFNLLHEVINQYSFNSLNKPLQHHILRKLKNKNFDGESSFSPIESRIHGLALENIRLFSGNIDAKKIRNVSEKYSLEVIADTCERRGADLKDIKDKRNAIAHGKKTLVELGKSVSFDEVKENKNEAIAYLRDLLNSLKKHLEDSSFLNDVGSSVQETNYQSPLQA